MQIKDIENVGAIFFGEAQPKTINNINSRLLTLPAVYIIKRAVKKQQRLQALYLDQPGVELVRRVLLTNHYYLLLVL